jgi:type VI secretion system protein ImpL
LRFLKSSRAITEAYFPPGAEAPRVDFDVRINPSPRVAIQRLNIGGKMIEYHNGPEEWHRFSWPGEDEPGAGAKIEIRGAGGMHERVEQEGEWGLFHLLERGTVISGAGARVFRVVWHLQTHDVDISIDFRPVRADTPFFGVSGDRSRDLMHPVRRSDVTVPRGIVSGGQSCPRSRGT